MSDALVESSTKQPPSSGGEVFRLPDVGEGLTEAEIVGWRVEVGQRVAVNDVLVEIETAKSLVELPSPVEGLVGELLVSEGDTIDVGAPIIRFAAPATESGAPESEPPARPEAPGGRPEPGGAPSGEPDAGEGVRSANLVGYGARQDAVAHRRRRLNVATGPADGSTGTGPPVLAKPPVRKLARELGVDLASVDPSGPDGTVTRDDVASAAARGGRDSPTARPVEPDVPAEVVADDSDRETRVPVRSVRRMTADAVTASAFSAPHVTEFLDVDVTRSYRLLDRLRVRKDFAGLKVSPILLVAKAMCLAAGRTPEINASWDGPSNEIVYKNYVNLGIAAATPRGLLVPNVKDAERMPLPLLCREINDLVAVARAGRTTPDQMQGGTITLTNVGVFGVDTGTPILNAGESAILAVGAVADRAWVHKKKVRARKVMTLALSFDHRVVDGEQGSRFLADVGVILSDPATTLLWT